MQLQRWHVPARWDAGVIRHITRTLWRRMPPAVLLVGAVGLLASGCGASSTNSALQARLLSSSDLPAGWAAAPSTANHLAVKGTSCLANLPAHPKGFTYASASFVEGTAVPTFSETLSQGKAAARTWRRLQHDLKSCRTADLVIGGKTYRSTVHPLALPRIGTASAAYTWAFHIAGIPIGSDLILFRLGSYRGEITYGSLGPPLPRTVMTFAHAAVKKIKSGTALVPPTVSITSAPVRIAHTTLGNVAYREIGNGPPLLMIMGYGGTMDTWDPRFIDALAQHYQVVVFNNAGIGSTAALPKPISIDAMANQTSALIHTLGFKRTNVLGWSMGSMIAQALTVLHPSQVQKLILCAGYPGNGKSLQPTQAAINDLNSGNAKKIDSVLFPANQQGAQNTYLAALSSYSDAPSASATIISAQAGVVLGWWAGKDPAGHGAAAIKAPTLVADGMADRLDPIRNTYLLAHLIPGAKTQVYPDAGHAFLFQYEASFIPVIRAFLNAG